MQGYPTGGEGLDEYLRLSAQKRNRMPASGYSTAARPPAPQTHGVPMAGDGPWTSLGKQVGGMAMKQGQDWLFKNGGDAFQKYWNQWQINNAAQGSPSAGYGSNGEYNMMGGDVSGAGDVGFMAGDAAGGGADMAGMMDWSSLMGGGM